MTCMSHQLQIPFLPSAIRLGRPGAGHIRKPFCQGVAWSSQTIKFVFNALLCILLKASTFHFRSSIQKGRSLVTGTNVVRFQNRVWAISPLPFGSVLENTVSVRFPTSQVFSMVFSAFYT